MQQWADRNFIFRHNFSFYIYVHQRSDRQHTSILMVGQSGKAKRGDRQHTNILMVGQSGKVKRGDES